MPSMLSNTRFLAGLVFGLMLCIAARGNAVPPRVLVAVAANFSDVARALGEAFAAESLGTVEISSGSTGKLYAQIQNGAPYDVFLAADRMHPEKLIAEGYALADTRVTYAIGRLALFSTTLPVAKQGAATLESTTAQHISIANPESAPYGRAALETLKSLQQWDAIAPRIVYGENIAQAFQFVKSGAAELGLIAYAQVIHEDTARYWLVPESLHTPLAQDAVLLKHGEANSTARAFLEFLQREKSRDTITRSGYAMLEKP